MPSITIRDIPDELYDKLKQAARRRRRSLGDEALALLASQLGHRKISRRQLLQRARQCRQMTRELGVFATPEDIDRAINQGRP